jgi:cell division protein ZapA (FtsZ GTPase activity inhibitor)
MAEDQLHTINVEVAGRSYPVFVSEEEEMTVRDLAANLNLEIEDLHKRYANKLSKADILAMLLLTYAKKHHDATASDAQNRLSDKLDELYLMLEEATT